MQGMIGTFLSLAKQERQLSFLAEDEFTRAEHERIAIELEAGANIISCLLVGHDTRELEERFLKSAAVAKTGVPGDRKCHQEMSPRGGN